MSQMNLFPSNSHFDRSSHQKDVPQTERVVMEKTASVDVSSVYQDLIDLHGDMEAKYGRDNDFVFRLADIVSDVYGLIR